MNSYTKFNDSPLRFFFLTGLSIFLIDFAVTLLFLFFPALKPYEMILDAVLLTGLISPLLYFNLLRPMRVQIRERQQAEEALRKSGKVLEDIFSVNYLLIAYMDARFNFIRVNRAYADADHRDPEFLVGKNHFDLYPNAENQAIFEKVVATGEPTFIFEKPFVYPDHPEMGVTYWNWSLMPIKNQQGQVTELVFTLSDVTRLRKTEIALRESERKFRAIFNQTFEFIGLLTPEGRVVEINQSALDFAGLRIEDTNGFLFWDLPYWNGLPDASRRVQEAVTQAVEGRFIRIETDVQGKAGTRLLIDFSLKPVLDEDQKVVYLISEGRDISSYKQIEAELVYKNQELQELSIQERTQRQLTEGIVQSALALNTSVDIQTVLDRILQEMLNVIPCRAGMLLYSEEDHIRLVSLRGSWTLPENRSMIDRLYEPDEFPFMKILATRREAYLEADTGLVPGKHFPPFLDWVSSYAAVPLCTGDELVGSICLVSRMPGFFTPETGRLLSAFASQAEVAIHNAQLFLSMQKALEHEQELRTRLVQEEKFSAMGRLLASVSHELNNPIQTIKNCLFLAREDTPTSSPVLEYLEIASIETERIARLVSHLREIYRPRPNPVLQPLRLTPLLESLHTLLDPALRDGHVTLRCDLHASEDRVSGDENQLKQVFINICMNAVEATSPGGGELSINLIPSAGEIGVQIKDQGQGIPPENLQKLYEPFFTTKTNGLGLGLSICYEIIQRHSGRIDVESSIGEGTTFTVWLPLLENADSQLTI